ncbi:MAG TPA: hypothetical protein VKD26_09340 [Streptosporangiaceae bacterium]|nr:hypothetical protein [Streptosporangiaceae bacterium]
MARAGRAAAILAGCLVMAYGAWGLLLSHAVPHTANLLVWLTASLLGNDAVIAPIVFALCLAGTRLLPVRARPWAAGALLVGGAALLVGLPDVLRQRRDPNPTVVPLDYGRNIALVLLLVAGAAIAAWGGPAAVRAARRAVVGYRAHRAAARKVPADHERNAPPPGHLQQGDHPHDRQL